MTKKTSKGGETVQFALFGGSPHNEQLVRLWHDGAKDNVNGGYSGAYLRFAQLWFAFNNWAMCVTEADTDREMIGALAKSPALQRSFAKLLAENATFRNDVTAFAQFWPIFNVKDIRRKGLRHLFVELDRQSYAVKMSDARIRHAPANKFDRNTPTWNQTLQAVYQVRCNLFHGEKGDASDDAGIVNGALKTMLEFIDATALYQRRSADDHSAEPVFEPEH